MLDTIIEASEKEIESFEAPKIDKPKPKPKRVVKTKKQTAKKKKQKPEPTQESTLPVTSDKPSIPQPEITSQDKPSLFQTFLENVDTSKMGITTAEMGKLQAGVDNINNSFTCILRTCNSSKCRQKGICPFTNIKRYPEGQICPVEKAIAEFMSKELYAYLASELDGIEFNIIEINTINSIIEVEIEEFRTRVIINEDGPLVQYAAFALKESEEVIYNQNEHPLYNLRERLDRRKAKLLQRLLLTPEAKARFKVEDKSRSGRKTEDLIQSAEDKINQLKAETLDGTEGSTSSTE